MALLITATYCPGCVFFYFLRAIPVDDGKAIAALASDLRSGVPKGRFAHKETPTASHTPGAISAAD